LASIYQVEVSQTSGHACLFCIVRVVRWNQGGDAGEKRRQLDLAPRPRLREHSLQMSPHRSNFDVSTGGDFGHRPATGNADRIARLDVGRPEIGSANRPAAQNKVQDRIQ